MSELRKITQNELDEILDLHRKYLHAKEGGVCADLSNCDLSGLYLAHATLNAANLNYSIFDGADCSGADFSYSNLQGANCNGANFSGSDCIKTDMSTANLKDANFSGCNEAVTSQLLLFNKMIA